MGYGALPYRYFEEEERVTHVSDSDASGSGAHGGESRREHFSPIELVSGNHFEG
jgi:hypothetical protein